MKKTILISITLVLFLVSACSQATPATNSPEVEKNVREIPACNFGLSTNLEYEYTESHLDVVLVENADLPPFELIYGFNYPSGLANFDPDAYTVPGANIISGSDFFNFLVDVLSSNGAKVNTDYVSTVFVSSRAGGANGNTYFSASFSASNNTKMSLMEDVFVYAIAVGEGCADLVVQQPKR